ncbi:MAG: TolC family protein [Candidatus Latescibacteria bacterium]|nr:TolC family protein [bacterium]MBD3423335.1 TolC family protein [Candidatus Latescibacterota bacterium]
MMIRKTALISAAILTLFFQSAIARKSLTLDEAIETGMENSPLIMHYRYNLKRSRASLSAARARLKSKFSLSVTPVSYTENLNFNDQFSEWYRNETTEHSGIFRIEQPIKWTDGTISLINRLSWRESYSSFTEITDESYTNDFYISLAQPLFTYNRTKLDLEELELDLENTRLQYLIQKLSLEMQITEGFYNLYKIKKSLEIAVEDRDIKQESYDIMKNKVEAGLSKREDLYQAELSLANSELTLKNEQVNLENALDNFKKLLGIPVRDEISISADISYDPVEVDLKKAIEHGLSNRMELEQARIDIQNARNAIIETGARNEFYGNLELSYGSIGQDEKFADIYQQPEKSQQLRLSFEVPLWDWGEKESMLEASRTTLKSRQLDLESTREDIMIEIRQTHRQIRNQMVRIEIADKNVKNSQLTYEINLERYRNGDLTTKDLNYYQNQLAQEKNSRVSALIQYKLYLLEMKIKSLWDFENGISVIQEIE